MLDSATLSERVKSVQASIEAFEQRHAERLRQLAEEIQGAPTMVTASRLLACQQMLASIELEIAVSKAVLHELQILQVRDGSFVAPSRSKAS